MTCYAYRAWTMTATIALVAGGYLALSGTTADPAAAQSNESKNEGESVHVWSAPSKVGAAESQAERQYVAPQYVGAYSKPADNAADIASGKTNSDANKDGWSIQVSPGASQVDPAKVQAGAQNADEKSEKKTEKKTAEAPASTAAEGSTEIRKTSKMVQDSFRPDPQYDDNYNAEGQVGVYGSKKAVEPPRPPIEIGRQQYTSGGYDESGTILGEKNPLLPGLAVYGDWRTAAAYNQNNGKDIAQIATRLNIDVDFKITGTERIHAFFTPLQDNTQFTRYEFGGNDGNDRFNDEFDLDPQTLFFEGDVGSIYTGFSGNEATFDLPFTVGLFPLFLQNGIWANDAILGGAVSLPAKNSAALGLANFDVTFFAAFKNVDNKGIIGANEDDNDNANLYGVTAFVDAYSGYIEAGYALIDGYDDQDGLLVNFLTAAYSRRYYNTLSNSTRLFANFGSDPEGNADGLAIISENSLISGLPSTLLPYGNFFVGFGNPQPLVDGNGAGILKNVGINFETDALTGYPKLDDTGSNTLGGAIGLQYLFNLDQQLVFEVAMVQPFEDDGIGAKDAQYGFGVRYQIPINRAWLFRADATYQLLENAEEDNFGIRTEVRRKF